jgi:hypothetical protein
MAITRSSVGQVATPSFARHVWIVAEILPDAPAIRHVY